MKIRTMGILGALLLLAVAAAWVAFQQRIYTDSRIAMDTVVSVSVVARSADKARMAFERVFDEIDRIGANVNFYSDKSEINSVNMNAGLKAVKVSDETREIVNQALKVSEMTGGAFDITTGAVTVLWDFKTKLMPEDKELRKRAKLVSYKSVVVDDEKGTVFLKRKGMMIDLGGIAKGFAADRAVDALRSIGIKAALVSVAGDIRAYGVKPSGQPWRVGIQDPRPADPSNNVMAALALNDRAISTSGDYQRYFEVEGVRYHHLLDPASGMPARGCRSVTVIAESGAMADPVATAVFVLGPEKGLALLQKIGLEGLVVEETGKVHVTDGLREVIEMRTHEK